VSTDVDIFEAEFGKKYQEQADKIGRFNLAIFGKTGVGKSTLINAIFGEDVALTGIGEPVTLGEHLYLHQSGFLGLYDTRGLEIGVDTDALIKELGGVIDRTRQLPESDQIHVAWYCVRASDNRFEEAEADFIRHLHALGLPVILVLTQVPSRGDEYHADAIALADYISGLDLPLAWKRPIFVMARGDDFVGQSEHGLNDLLDATFRVAPEGVEAALIAAQKIDLNRKRKHAQTAIAAAAGAAAVAGAVPIPFADAALLVPIQMSLMASVSAIYGVKLDTAALSATVATSVATAAGRSAVGGLLKLIPGAGTIVGGAISAGVASTFTFAIGYAWAEVCRQLVQGRLKGVDGALDSDALRTLFTTELKKWFEKLRAGKSSKLKEHEEV
jgi:uncharacterized protein (DUF697 family)